MKGRTIAIAMASYAASLMSSSSLRSNDRFKEGKTSKPLYQQFNNRKLKKRKK